METEVRHIVPLDDLKEHDYIDVFCDCAPEIEMVDTYHILIKHKAYDHREEWEHKLIWTLH